MPYSLIYTGCFTLDNEPVSPQKDVWLQENANLDNSHEEGQQDIPQQVG